MIIDTLNTFADGVALNTGGAATYFIGDVIDLEAARDIGNGSDHLYFVAMVDTTATSGGAATLQIKLVSDAQAAISTTTATEHVVTETYALADLTAGKRLIAVRLPLESPVYERYLGILQVTGTAAFTAGAIDAFFTFQPDAWKAYAEGQN